MICLPSGVVLAARSSIAATFGSFWAFAGTGPGLWSHPTSSTRTAPTVIILAIVFSASFVLIDHLVHCYYCAISIRRSRTLLPLGPVTIKPPVCLKKEWELFV